MVLANELKAAGILVLTRRGDMARHTAWLRPRHSPIFALCARPEVAAGLTLCRAVTPLVVPFDLINPENTIDAALKEMVAHGRLRNGDTVVIIALIMVVEQIVDAVQMRVV